MTADRAELQAALDKAKASLGSSAGARKKRGRELKNAVVNASRLRSSDRSETTVSFRCSAALKQRLAAHRVTVRQRGETLNRWMERTIEAALDAEERRK